MSTRNVLLALAASLCLSSNAFADVLELNPDHPQRHVVVKGDTLWDISSKFLLDPWRWPEVWNINPDIKNPHLIYPGDVIILTIQDGKPVLELERKAPAKKVLSDGRPVVKLSPKTHVTRLSSAIPTIPSSAISQFLIQPRILTEEQVELAGYITEAEEHRLISGEGSKVYVTNMHPDANKNFSIYSLGKVYRNPEDDDDVLGYEAIHVADAQLIREGNPTTLKIKKSYRETKLGDKVLPTDEKELEQNFTPSAPEDEVNGRVIALMEGMSRVGQYQVVTINLGTNDGIKQGHVLAVRQYGKVIKDQFSPRFFKPKLKLPDERSGLLMVIRTFDRLSYALVMNAVKDISVGDPVNNP